MGKCSGVTASTRYLRKLAWAIRPDLIDIAVPTRPPAERWVEPPEPEAVIRAQRSLRSVESMTRPETGDFEIAGFGTVLDAIRGLGSRHPLRWDQAEQIEAAFEREGELDRLIDPHILQVVWYGKEKYVTSGPSHPHA